MLNLNRNHLSKSLFNANNKDVRCRHIKSIDWWLKIWRWDLFFIHWKHLEGGWKNMIETFHSCIFLRRINFHKHTTMKMKKKIVDGKITEFCLRVLESFRTVSILHARESLKKRKFFLPCKSCWVITLTMIRIFWKLFDEFYFKSEKKSQKETLNFFRVASYIVGCFKILF